MAELLRRTLRTLLPAAKSAQGPAAKYAQRPAPAPHPGPASQSAQGPAPAPHSEPAAATAAAAPVALLLLMAAALVLPPAAAGQTNPFLSGGGESSGQTETESTGESFEQSDTQSGERSVTESDGESGDRAAEPEKENGGALSDPLRGLKSTQNRFLGTIVSLQRSIHGRLVELFHRRGLSADSQSGEDGGEAAGGSVESETEEHGTAGGRTGEGSNPPVVALLLGFAMLYGMLHALGPGHRKTVLFSYFISAGGKWWHGIAAGIGLAVVHAGSALVAVFAIHSILQATFSGSLNNVQRLMETISYLAIAVMGILLFLHAIREAREHGEHGHSAHRGRTTGRTTGRGKLEPLFIVLSAGIVPCPGAATLLIFGITLQAIPLAVAALLSMSLGMGITLSAVGVLTLTMKEGLLQLIGGGRRTERVASVLEVAGALFILLFGLFMGLPPLLAWL